MLKTLKASFFFFFFCSFAYCQAAPDILFGFAAPDPKNNSLVVRVEMPMTGKAMAKGSRDLLDLFKVTYDADKPTEFGDKKLTDSQFSDLSDEKTGAVYTFFIGQAVFQGKVTGGSIAIDDEFSDMYRVYLNFQITPGTQGLPNGSAGKKVDILAFKGPQPIQNIETFMKAFLGKKERNSKEALLRKKLGPLFHFYKTSFYRRGSDLVAAVYNRGLKHPDSQVDWVADNLKPYDSGAYLVQDKGLVEIFPADKEEGLDNPSSFVPEISFELNGERYYWFTEFGQACCAGGPYRQQIILKYNPKANTFIRVSNSGTYPIGIELFI